VIVIHGGFWRMRYDLSSIGHLAAALTARGLATWTIEYRRVGHVTGGWPYTLLDVAAAADHLRVLATEYPLDSERVIALGHSAGGHLALWLAARSRVGHTSPLHAPNPIPLLGAVSLGGVADLRAAWRLRLGNGAVEEFMGGAPDAYRDRYAVASPAEMLPLGVPQVLIHGVLDEPVPFTIAENYCDLALGLQDPVRLVALEGMGHFEPIDPTSEAWPFVEEAVSNLAWK